MRCSKVKSKTFHLEVSTSNSFSYFILGYVISCTKHKSLPILMDYCPLSRLMTHKDVTTHIYFSIAVVIFRESVTCILSVT
jgi:hypothetical protein